jgi:PAS domain S-box-containing protein
LDLSGYDRDELIGSSTYLLMPPEMKREAIERREQSQGRPFETVGISKDGRRIEVEIVSREIPYMGRTARVTAIRDITERKEQEEALRKSDERYRLVAENIHDVIWTMNLDLEFRYVSPSVSKRLGYSPEEFVDLSLDEIMTPSSLERVNEAIEETLRPILAGEADPHINIILELELVRKDGSKVLTEISTSMLLDPSGEPIGIIGVIRDVTERKAAEEAKAKSEAQYRLLAENVEDIIFTIGQDLTFNYLSPSFERLTGYTGDELRSMGWQGIFAPDSLERLLETVDEDALGISKGATASERSILVEAEILVKDGSSVWIEVNVSGIPNAAGQVVEMLGVARDITERRKSENAVRESEERYRLLAENVADIIFVMGSDLTFDYVSPSFEKLTGFKTEELSEMGWQDMLTPASLETAMAILSEGLIESMEEGTSPYESVILEMEAVTKEGRPVWMEVNLSILHDSKDHLRGILGVARDVTERKQTQEQLEDEKKRAELYLDLFGHDIRNINQGIMSYLELVLMKPGIEAPDAEYIKNVLEQATRINDLVAKVQRLTHLRTSEIKIEDVDASKLIHGAIDYVSAKYPERDIKIETSESIDCVVVKGSHLLRDVFTSILDNSVRFDRNDTVVVDISCDTSDDEEYVRFVISDRGPGMPDEMKAMIFHRLDQPEGGVKGTGLGLTVVWEIIKRFDGRIWVEDRVPGEPGQGSRFMIELARGSKDG